MRPGPMPEAPPPATSRAEEASVSRLDNKGPAPRARGTTHLLWRSWGRSSWCWTTARASGCPWHADWWPHQPSRPAPQCCCCCCRPRPGCWGGCRGGGCRCFRPLAADGRPSRSCCSCFRSHAALPQRHLRPACTHHRAEGGRVSPSRPDTDASGPHPVRRPVGPSLSPEEGGTTARPPKSSRPCQWGRPMALEPCEWGPPGPRCCWPAEGAPGTAAVGQMAHGQHGVTHDGPPAARSASPTRMLSACGTTVADDAAAPFSPWPDDSHRAE